MSGELNFISRLDNSTLRANAIEAASLLKKVGDTGEDAGSRIKDSFANASNLIKTSIASIGLGSLVKKVFEVRSAFQDTESSMTVFLGSAKKAQDFMKKLQDYAWYNMFEFSDLTQESSKLLAFGNDVNNIIPILDKLSNIASGTKKPLNELVDLFNKAKSKNKVESQDLEAWGIRGLVITDELKALGIEVDRSAIKFEHLEQVINKVTSEGGRFHGLMASQMDNLSSSWGQLQDNVTNMFNEIGTVMQDSMKAGIDAVSYLVDHYKEIGRVLLDLVVIYGTYRVALAAAMAVKKIVVIQQNAYNAAVTAQALIEQARAAQIGINMTLEQARNKVIAAGTVQVKLHTLAQMGLMKALNKVKVAMLSNPYMLAAVAVAALVYTIYKLVTAKSAEEKAHENVEKILEKEKEKYDNLSSTADQYTQKIKDTNQVLSERIRLYKELQKLFPEAFGDIGFEDFLKKSNDEIEKLKNQSIKIQQDKKRDTQIKDLQELIEAYKESLDYSGMSLYKYSLKLDKFDEYIEALKEKYKGNDGMLAAIKDYDESAKDSEDNTVLQTLYGLLATQEEARQNDLEARMQTIEYYEEEIAKAEARKQEFLNEWEAPDKIPYPVKKFFDKILNRLTELNNLKNKLFGGGGDGSKNKNFWEEQLKAANEAINSIDSQTLKKLKSGKTKGIDSKIIDDYNTNVKLQKEAQKELEAYNDKNNDKLAEKQKELQKTILKYQQEANKEKIELMQDGLNKELAEIEFEYNRRIAEIDENEKELANRKKEAGKGNLTDEEKDIFKTQRGTAKKSQEQKTEDVNTKYADEVEKLYHEIGDVFVSEEERKRASIKKTYDELEKRLLKLYEGGKIGFGEYAVQLVNIDAARTKAYIQEDLEEFKSYQQKREDLIKKYTEKEKQMRDAANKEINAAEKDKMLKAAEEIRKAGIKAVADLDASVQDSSGLLFRLLDNGANYSVSMLRRIIKETKQMLDYIKNTPDADIIAKFGLTREQLLDIKNNADVLQSVLDGLTDKENDLTAKNPFGAFVKGISDLVKKRKEIAEARKELEKLEEAGADTTEAQKGIDNLKDEILNLLGTIAGAAGEIGKYFNMIGDSLSQIGQAAGDAGVESIGKLMSDVGGILEAFAEGPVQGVITTVTTVLTSIFESESKYKAALEQMRKDRIAFLHEYRLALSDLRLEAEWLKNAFGQDDLKIATESLSEAHKMYEEFYDTMMTKAEKKKGIWGLTEMAFQDATKRLFSNNTVLKQLGIDADTAEKIIESLSQKTTKLQNIWIQTRHRTMFRSAKGVYLKDLYPELFDEKTGELQIEAARALLETNNQLNDEARRQLQEVIDLYDQWQKAEEQFKEYLSQTFGDIGAGLGDAIVEAFKTGKDAMEIWAESFNKVLENLGKQIMYSIYFRDMFDKLEDDLRNIYTTYGDDEETLGRIIQQRLGNFFNTVNLQASQAEEWYKNWADMSQQYGFDLYGDEGREAAQKGLASISQDSANELNGRFAALQALTFEINSNLKILVQHSQMILVLLSGIENNTRYCQELQGMRIDMITVKSAITELNTIGIRIRTG
jgi:DNA repair exonuclease SbcCD ATPase subunit